MPELVRLGERILVFISLLYLTQSLYKFFPLAVTSIIQYIIYTLFFLLLLARWQRTIYTAKKDLFIWILLTLAVCSFLWSSFPTDTIRNSIVAWQTASVGLYLASCYTTKQQLQLMGWTFGIIVVLNFIYTLLFPELGIDTEEHIGAWQGIYSHKNVLSQMITLSSLVFLFLSMILRRYRYLAWGGLFLSVALLLLSTSKTALIVFLSLVVILQIYRALRWRNTKAILVLTIMSLTVVSVIIVLIGNAEVIVSSMGKDISLSGRTGIWTGVWEQIQQKPLLGYGRSAFWHEDGNMSALVGSYVGLNYLAPHSHNGFLDLTADLGIIGLVLFLLSFIFAFNRAFNRARLNSAPEDLWHIMYLSFFFLYNLTESSLMVHNSALWAVYVAVVLSINPINSQEKILQQESDSINYQPNHILIPKK
jgi:O-antigen ligase